MKQFSILFILVITMSSLFAQRSNTFLLHTFDVNAPSPELIFDNGKAAGDSLFYFDGRYIKGKGTGTPAFNYSTQDLDLLTINSIYTSAGFPAKASFLPSYDVIAPGDTNFYFVTVSYFDTSGTADDWLSFGPIVIPAAGATLSWKHNYPDNKFRDGYKVHINTTGLGAANFTGSPFYTVTDNDASTLGDTIVKPVSFFYSRSKSLSAYAGQSIYLGFQHTAVDQDILLIDDILIKENSITAIDEDKALGEAIRIYPNPSNGLFTVNMGTASKSHVEVYNAMGEKVYSQDNTLANVSIDLTGLGAGIYSMKVLSSDNILTVKELVITK
jgi:Secretion system C-terminal sorting domain/Cleaved Adhesin Domain